MLGLLWLFIAIALFGSPLTKSVWAQTDMGAAIAHADKASSDRPPGAGTDRDAVALPATPNDVVLGDPATQREYLTAMQRYYAYRSAGYTHRSRVFEWQLFSSKITFAVVLTLVGLGIYFAAVQFRVAMRKGPPRPLSDGAITEVPASPSALATHIELSTKGVAVNSSVLGVIILALSLGFFYLYLVHVYPIKEIL